MFANLQKNEGRHRWSSRARVTIEQSLRRLFGKNFFLCDSVCCDWSGNQDSVNRVSPNPLLLCRKSGLTGQLWTPLDLVQISKSSNMIQMIKFFWRKKVCWVENISLPSSEASFQFPGFVKNWISQFISSRWWPKDEWFKKKRHNVQTEQCSLCHSLSEDCSEQYRKISFQKDVEAD